MLRTNDIVRHNIYGLGRIVDICNACASVRFRNGIWITVLLDNLRLEPF